jgi:hypothetical protein
MAEKEKVADRELAKQLVGKTIRLSPRIAFFFEDNSQYVLNAHAGYDDLKSEFKNSNIVIKEGWKLEPTMRNVKAGILRVFDEKGVDISQSFGGPALPPNRKEKPIVTGAPLMFDKSDQRDVKLRALLDNVNEKEVLQVVESNRLPLDLLERLYELELAGENPAYRSRAAIVEGIKELMKRTHGITDPKKLEDEETITTVRR